MNRRWLLLYLVLHLGLPLLLRAQSASFQSNSVAEVPPSCNNTTSSTPQWFDRKLQLLSAEFLESLSSSNTRAPEQAALLERIYELRESVSHPEAVDPFLEAASQNKLLSPLAQAEAAFLAIQTALHQGDLQRIEARYSALGYVRRWRITEENFPIDGSALHWKKFLSAPTPWLEIGDELWPQTTYITLEADLASAQEQDVVFRFSAETPATVYLNNAIVIETAAASTISFDQYTVAAHLKTGANIIRVRLSRSAHSDLRIALRISDKMGQGFDTASKIIGRDSLPSSAPDDLIRIAQQNLAEHRTEKNLETLFWLKRTRQASETWSVLQEAINISPTAELLFELAQYRSEPTQKLETLRKVLSNDAEYLPALLKMFDHYWGRGENYKAALLLGNYLQSHPCEPEPMRLLADLKRSQGDFSSALKEFRALANRKALSLNLRHELANRFAEFGLLEQARRLAEPLVAMDFDSTEERQFQIRLDEQALDIQALLADYSQLHALYPHDRLILKKLVLFEQQVGKNAEALRRIEAALDLNPQDADLLKTKSALLQHTEGQFFPQRTADSNSHLRELLSGKSELRQDEDHSYLEDAALLASDWRALPAQKRAASRILAEVRIERISEKYLGRSHVQKIIGIANSTDVQRFGLETIRYSPESEHLKIICAHILKADGRVMEAEDVGDSSVADAQSAMYYDVRARNIRFSRLEAGDVIELEYRLVPLETENPYGKYFAELVSFGTEVDNDLRKYVVIAPANIKVFFQQKDLLPPQSTSEGAFKVYRWQAQDLKAMLRESRSPSWTEIAPYVHISTIETWQDLGRWYADLIAPQFALDVSLERIAEQIRKKNHSDLERIQAVHEFVIRNTHYVALEFGIYSYKPYPVTQTFQRRFGDCKDKASLIIALLRAMGIQAEIALVRSQRLGKIKTEPASVAVFDHAIAYVPKYDLWLDGTAEFSGLRELPIEDQGAMALTVAKGGESTLREIPVSSPIDNYTWRSVQAELGKDGTIHFSGVNYVRGQDAAGMRRELEKTERQQEFVRGRLAEVLPSVEISAVSVPGMSNLEDDFTLSYRGEIQPQIQTGLLSIPSSWMPRLYLASLAPAPSREQELLLQAPWTTEEELHIKLTNGSALIMVPGDLHVENEFGSATLKYTKMGDELVVFSSIQFRKVRIHPQEYSAFRAFAETLESAFRREVQVRMP